MDKKPSTTTVPETLSRHDAQIETLTRDTSELTRAVGRLTQTVSDGFERIGQRLTEQDRQYSGRIAEASRPNWSAIGVAVTLLIALGAFAYWPIAITTSHQSGELQRLREAEDASMLDRRDLDRRLVAMEMTVKRGP